MVVCFLGVLPSLERDECKRIIQVYGGRVTTAVSGKTDYLIAGRDAGKTKIDKAEKLRTKIISEDDLLEMIRTRPGSTNINVKTTVVQTPKRVENKEFVPVLSPKLKFYKQDDGVLCKL